MDKMALLEAIEALVDGSGPVYAKITTETQVIWVEVTGVKNASPLDPPWQNGVLEFDTKPIPEGVGARMNRPDVYLLPGNVFLPGGLALKAKITSEQGPELLSAADTAHVVEITEDKTIIHSPLHGRMYEDQDPAESHYGDVTS
jgi:hypothetical protein